MGGLQDPVWLPSACSQAQESQQGGAVQGGRLGVWERSDPVMSVPEDSHYCWKRFFLNVIVAGSLKNYRPAEMNQVL